MPKDYRIAALAKFDLLAKRFKELEVREQREALRQRYQPRFQKAGLSYRNHYQKAIEICRAFRGSTGYTMGERITLHVAGHWLVSYDNTSEYAPSSKYKAKHGDLTIQMTLKEFKACQVIADIVTILEDEVKPGIRRASWMHIGDKYQHAYYFWIDGYFVEDVNFHSTSLQRARNRQNSITEREDIKNRTFVGFDDARAVGNCEYGIKAFCERHKLDPEMGYRKDFLVNLEPDNPYVQRLV